VSLCATRGLDAGAAAELRATGVEAFGLARRNATDLTAFRPLATFLRRERVDVLHSHKIGSNLWGTFLGRLCRVPVIVAHEHTWSYEGQRWRKLLDGHFIGRFATRFVAVSSADRQRMIDLEGVPAEKALVVPTAFIPRAREREGNLRAELGIPADAPVAGTVAVLRPQKALDMLIEAFAGVRRGLPEARLVIVGDGPSRQALEACARMAGVGDAVTFTGVRSDLATVLDGLDVAVMSSDFEGLPLFVFECMAHEAPLLATAVGGIPDVVVDGETGVLVPPRDPSALGEALDRLLRDPAERRRLASQARERLGEYTLERAAGRFAELYEELLAEAGRPVQPSR
jgi:glycosyltransferase involved in cell wall biosynthesis